LGFGFDWYLDNETPTNPLAPDNASPLYQRFFQNEERKIFQGLADRGFLNFTDVANFEGTTQAWLMRGAIREDDNDISLYSIGDRDEDPWGNHFRAPSHFYDPISNSAYAQPGQCTVATFSCRRSTEWALGRTDLLTGDGILEPNRRNHFTWEDARNNYWWALTMVRNFDGNTTLSASDREFSSRDRAHRFATMVTSLGHVIHLLQDASQPQHTRNDAHGPPVTAFATLVPSQAGDGAFEQFTEARLLGLDLAGSSLEFFDGNVPSPDLLSPIKLFGILPYPIPRFRLPMHYFTTRALDGGNPLDRRGLADYSNRGFFTFGTLPKSDLFALPVKPSSSPTTYTQVPYNTGLIAGGEPVIEQLYLATVPDTLNPGYDVQSGMFAAFGGKIPLLRRSNFARGFDLLQNPQPSFEDAGLVIDENVMTYTADAVLGRAAAYSAGMIDYFFRGRLDIEPADQKVFAVLNQGETHTVDADGYPRKPDGSIFGFEKIRLKVRNATDPIIESGTSTNFPQTVG
jgi:hypothetical protein